MRVQHASLFFLMALPLCMAQMCGTPGPAEFPAPDHLATESGSQTVPSVACLDDYQQATWLVMSGNSVSLSRATSFAVGPYLLATNAHVTQGIISDMEGPNGFAYAFQNETGATATITAVWTHPAYSPFGFSPFGPLYSPVTPDVGVMLVDTELPVTVPLASDESLTKLEVLDEVSLCGFPGALGSTDFLGFLTTGEFHPRTSCFRGTISSLRPFDPGQASTPANCDVIQYDMPTAPGTSGSAVFNSIGEVIGIHATGSASGAVSGDYNFAIRSNRLRDLLGSMEAGMTPVDLASLGPVCKTAYFDMSTRFGFNPPVGWAGPLVPISPNPNMLVDVRFTAPGGAAAGAMDVRVFVSLQTNPYDYIHELLEKGSIMVSQPFVSSPTNGVSYYFVTQNPNGVRFAECFGFAFGRGYYLGSVILPGDPPELASAIEASMKSLCIDTP